MAAQYTPCQACGAVGEVGKKCQFCGTTIMVKEGADISEMRLVPKRNISPQKYAEKISLYHNVKATKSPKLTMVSIGSENGLINLDGELVYPLQHEYNIVVVSDNIIYLRGTQDKLISQSGKPIYLGTLLNLETMDTCTKIESGAGDLSFFAWENQRCKGRIDPYSWEIVERPSLERTMVAMTPNEYIEKKKQRMAELEREEKIDKEIRKREREERKIETEKQEQKKENIKMIFWGLILAFAYFAFQMLVYDR